MYYKCLLKKRWKKYDYERQKIPDLMSIKWMRESNMLAMCAKG